jgi:hypothetical protein
VSGARPPPEKTSSIVTPALGLASAIVIVNDRLSPAMTCEAGPVF